MAYKSLNARRAAERRYRKRIGEDAYKSIKRAQYERHKYRRNLTAESLEKYKAQKRKYWHKNKTKINIRVKELRQSPIYREKYLAQKRASYVRNKEKRLARQKKLYKSEPDRQRHIIRLCRYKITKDNYEKMRQEQNFSCAICKKHENNVGKKLKRLSVDHNHKTGKVRALLCSGCNTLIGKEENNPGLFDKAKEYLRKHNEIS